MNKNKAFKSSNWWGVLKNANMGIWVFVGQQKKILATVASGWTEIWVQDLDFEINCKVLVNKQLHSRHGLTVASPLQPGMNFTPLQSLNKGDVGDAGLIFHSWESSVRMRNVDMCLHWGETMDLVFPHVGNTSNWQKVVTVFAGIRLSVQRLCHKDLPWTVKKFMTYFGHILEKETTTTAVLPLCTG